MNTDDPTGIQPEPLFLSVVIPVRNESRHIEEVLDGLLAQSYPPERFEILVIDGRSTDETRERVERYVERQSGTPPRIFLYDNPGRSSAAARNIGIDRMNGEAYLLVDGHCLIDNPDMLAETDRSLRTENVDCLGRPQPLETRGASLIRRAIAAARRSPLGHHPDSFIYAAEPCIAPAISVAVAYRKDVFEKVGRFDERFDAAEDCEFNYRCDRAGLRCLFNPKIAVRYVPRHSLTGLFRQLARYGRGRVRLFRKHPETFSLKAFLPALFLLGLLIGPAFFPAGTVFASVYAAVVAIYAVAVLGESARLAVRERSIAMLFPLPTVFAAIHFGSAWGTLAEFLFGKRISAGSEYAGTGGG